MTLWAVSLLLLVMSAFGSLVAVVGLCVAEKQVIWTYTTGIVAPVQNVHALGNVALGQLPGEPMGKPGFGVNDEVAVPLWVSGSGPEPAVGALVYFGPETIGQSFVVIDMEALPGTEHNLSARRLLTRESLSALQAITVNAGALFRLLFAGRGAEQGYAIRPVQKIGSALLADTFGFVTLAVHGLIPKLCHATERYQRCGGTSIEVPILAS